jgi:hypothetical protein
MIGVNEVVSGAKSAKTAMTAAAEPMLRSADSSGAQCVYEGGAECRQTASMGVAHQGILLMIEPSSLFVNARKDCVRTLPAEASARPNAVKL